MVSNLVKKIQKDVWVEDYSEAQKDITLLIRGSEYLFEELTGVKYQ